MLTIKPTFKQVYNKRLLRAKQIIESYIQVENTSMLCYGTPYFLSAVELFRGHYLTVENRKENPICTDLIRSSKVGDWLRKENVLAPLVCLTWGKLHCLSWCDFECFNGSYLFMWINLAFEILLWVREPKIKYQETDPCRCLKRITYHGWVLRDFIPYTKCSDLKRKLVTTQNNPVNFIAYF